MAIIIPSDKIYSKNNDKILNNKIKGVTYTDINYSVRDTEITTFGQLSDFNRQQTVYKEGNWVYNGTKRKKVIFNATTRGYQGQKTVDANTTLNNYSLSSLWVSGSMTWTNNSGWSDFSIPMTKQDDFTGIILPNPEAGEEILSTFVQIASYHLMDVTSFSGLIDSNYYDMIYIQSPTKITLQTTEEELINGTWQDLTTETIFEDSISAPTDVKVFQTVADSNTTIKYNGDEANYTLDQNDFLLSDTKINGVSIGQYISDKVIEKYANGKETAEIVCSISDYYDISGAEIISVSKEGLKFHFDIYDEVLPLIHTPNGEVPMSITADGLAKTFYVLGMEIYYDGAVWQKLHLQESGNYVEIYNSLSAPQIYIVRNALTIVDKSELAEYFEIYVNEVLAYTLTAQNTFDMSSLNLEVGNYEISVKSLANGYLTSKFSNKVDFIVN